MQARANTLSARIHANELILESSELPGIYVKFRAGVALEPDEVIRLKAKHQYQLWETWKTYRPEGLREIR